MAAPISLFLWMDRPLTSEEHAVVQDHLARWRPRFVRGASGYELEAISSQPPAAPPDAAFSALMREANVRTLIVQAVALEAARSAAPAGSDDPSAALRYAGRLQPGPAFARDVLTLLEAAKELGRLLPSARLRLHDGQLLRYAAPEEVDVSALRTALGL